MTAKEDMVQYGLSLFSEEDLSLESYDFDLSNDLIAQRPISPRHDSKLLVYLEDEDRVEHCSFCDLHRYLPEESVLITNKSKVFPCRLIGNKITGGKAEVFILSLVNQEGYQALIKTRQKKKLGETFFFGGKEISAEISKINHDGTFQLSFNLPIEEVLKRVGKMPIPPYIRKGESDELDNEDYQTLFAKDLGSVAAPTAGLHFTPKVCNSLEKKNIKQVGLTLHVGMGTFAPVKTDSLLEHQMHKESYRIEESAWREIKNAEFKTLVGTTSLRALESFYRDHINQTNEFHDTDIFLYPGEKVVCADALITNFHLPKSTLLMLVSSMIGRKKTMELYKIAIENKYRFFSYGDAMLIMRGKKNADK